jgi:hypothetical protein
MRAVKLFVLSAIVEPPRCRFRRRNIGPSIPSTRSAIVSQNTGDVHIVTAGVTPRI